MAGRLEPTCSGKSRPPPCRLVAAFTLQCILNGLAVELILAKHAAVARQHRHTEVVLFTKSRFRIDVHDLHQRTSAHERHEFFHHEFAQVAALPAEHLENPHYQAGLSMRRRRLNPVRRYRRHVMQAFVLPQDTAAGHEPGEETEQSAGNHQRFVTPVNNDGGSADRKDDAQQRQTVSDPCGLQQVVRLELEPYEVSRFEMQVTRNPRLEDPGSTHLQEPGATSAAGSTPRARHGSFHSHSNEFAARCYDSAFRCIWARLVQRLPGEVV